MCVWGGAEGRGGEGPSPGVPKGRVVETLPLGAQDEEHMHECNKNAFFQLGRDETCFLAGGDPSLLCLPK